MTGISVGDYRDPEARPRARAADGRGRARPGRRARAALERRGDPRQGLAARRARERAEGLPAPPRADAVRRRRRPARDGPSLHARGVPRPHRGAARRRARGQRHDRRDRRLPDRGRAGVRAHARGDRRRRDHTRSRLLVLPRPGTTAAGARRPRPAGREEAPLARSCAATPRCARATTAPAKLGRSREVLVDKVADTQCSGYTRGLHALLPARRRGRARRARRGPLPRAPRRRDPLCRRPAPGATASGRRLPRRPGLS